jgi:hypothetical protein
MKLLRIDSACDFSMHLRRIPLACLQNKWLFNNRNLVHITLTSSSSWLVNEEGTVDFENRTKHLDTMDQQPRHDQCQNTQYKKQQTSSWFLGHFS